MPEKSALRESLMYPPTIADGSAHVEFVAKALSTFGREVAFQLTNQTWWTTLMPPTCSLRSCGIDKWLWFVEAHSQASK